MTYSAMARFRDALRGEPRDRVPIFPMISGWAAANFSDVPLSRLAREPEPSVEAQIKAREVMGYDPLQVYSGYLAIHEAFGCQVRFHKTGPIVDPLPLKITCMEDIDNIRVPNPREEGKLLLVTEMVRLLNAYGGGDIPVLASFEGPFTTTCRIIEADLIMRMIYQNPQVLEALLDKVNGFLLEYGLELIENGANTVVIYEPTSSASMISPAMFRQFVMPRLQILTRELNVPCLLHMCGDTSPTLDAMGQTGADVLSLDQCMDLSKSRKMVPNAVLGGNVDPVNSLLMGTREQVVKDTINSLRTGGTSRFILMSGCGVPANTSVENLKIMIETAVEYGLGP